MDLQWTTLMKNASPLDNSLLLSSRSGLLTALDSVTVLPGLNSELSTVQVSSVSTFKRAQCKVNFLKPLNNVSGQSSDGACMHGAAARRSRRSSI